MKFLRSRPVRWVLCLLAGLVYGAAGTIAHSYRLGPVPVGVIVALIGVTGLLLGLRLLTGDRWSALAAGVGAFAATVVLSGEGPGGSVIAPDAAFDRIGGVSLGLVWGIGLAIAIMLVVAWPDLTAARRRRLD